MLVTTPATVAAAAVAAAQTLPARTCSPAPVDAVGVHPNTADIAETLAAMANSRSRRTRPSSQGGLADVAVFERGC